MAETTEARDAALQFIWPFWQGKGVLDEFAGFFWRFRRVGRILLHSLPKPDRVAELAGGEKPQPLVMFSEDERFAACRDGVPIAFLDRLAGFAPAQTHVFPRDS